MTRAWRSPEVTRIRGEFTTTPQVTDALNEFLDTPLDDIKLYTTAQRMLPTGEFARGVYDAGIQRITKRIQKIAESALVLADVAEVRIYANRSSRFFFDVRSKDQEKLDEVSDLIGESVTTGTNLSHHMLYAEFLPGKLTEDPSKAVRAMGQFAAQLHHPTAVHRMKTTNVSLVTKNIPEYLVHYGFLPKEA
jgi:hypothetical protein